MLSSIWDFLKDGTNQAVLNWIGGGIAAAAAGIWAVIKFRAKNGNDQRSASGASADRGSVAVAGDVTNSPININTRPSSKR